MIFGGIFSASSFSPINAFAADMPGDSMGGGDSGGEGDNNQGGNSEDEEDNDIPDSKEAPVTAGSLTAGGDSDSDSDNDNDSGGNRENDNDDNEPTSEDAPKTTEAVTAKKSGCPPGQEVALFSTSCVPSKESSPVKDSDLFTDFLGITKLQNYDVSSKKNPDGSTTDIFETGHPLDDNYERGEKTTSLDGTIKLVKIDEKGSITEQTISKGVTKTINKDISGYIWSNIEKTILKDGTEKTISKDKDNKIQSITENYRESCL
jgi:hypothetical protein